MEIYVNMLLEPMDANPEAQTDRVLWVSAESDEVVLIGLRDKSANPRYESYSELVTALERNELKVLEVDPYTNIVNQTGDIPEKHLALRDKAWSVIEPIIQLPRDGQFLRSERGPIITRLAREKRAAKSMIHHYLRCYWQGGQVKNALLPKYNNCGAPGKPKPDTSVKRGRPRKFKDSPKGEGINVSDETKRLFELGFKAIYENPKSPTKLTLHEAHIQIINRYFHRGYDCKNGILVPVLPPASSLPSYKQFEYWYRKTENVTNSITAREGKKNFNLRHRALGGDAASIGPGPGAFFQIDTTPGDVHLVSSLDQSPIGRPTIYLLVDVFSRLITGFSATVETPSYVSAMLAIENAACNKIEFCAKHGISISEKEWPCHHLPAALLGDRGEMLSKNANQLADNLSIRVSNAPPFRADLKPFVERMFRSLKDELIAHLPGAILKAKERGQRDPLLDATLTLPAFRHLLILWILDHNRKRIEGMRPREFMVENNLEPRPLDLWEWGVLNRSGHLRVMDPNLIRLNLLPSGEATVTAKGIRFKRALYTCDRALQNEWYVRARRDGTWKVAVAYDPREAGVLFLKPTATTPFEKCRLIESNLFYQACSWQEVDLSFSAGSQKKAESQSSDMQKDAEFRANLAANLNAAKIQTQAASKGQSKAERFGNMTANRQAERDRERVANQTPVPSHNSDKNISISPNGAPPINDSDYVPRPNNLEILEAAQEEIWNKK